MLDSSKKTYLSITISGADAGGISCFGCLFPFIPNSSTSEERLVLWIADAWRKDFAHGWAVPFLFVYFIYRIWPTMKLEPVRGSGWGLLGVAFVNFTLHCFGENAAAKAAAHRIAFFNRWWNNVCLRLEGCSACAFPRFFLVVCRFCSRPPAGD